MQNCALNLSFSYFDTNARRSVSFATTQNSDLASESFDDFGVCIPVPVVQTPVAGWCDGCGQRFDVQRGFQSSEQSHGVSMALRGLRSI